MTSSLWKWMTAWVIVVTHCSLLTNSDTCTPNSCRYDPPTTFLDCSNSGCVDVVFTNLTKNVTKLSLRNNQLTTVTSMEPFGRFGSGLLNIDLSANNISAIDGRAFYHGCNLTTVNLTRNVLTMDTLTRILFRFCGKLENLYLASNHLGNLTAVAFYNTQLKNLNLSDNGIVYLDHNALTDLRVLLSLDLSANSIKSLSARHFLGMLRLKFLDLSKNRLKTLPGKLFQGCSQLNTLDLSYNEIESIDNNTFFGLRNLSSLDLSGNMLSELDVQLVRLNQLNLSGNNLDNLSENLVHWPTVQSFDLSGNAWDCNCNLNWMLEAELDKESFKTLTCSSPLHLRGKRLAELTSTHLSCSLTVRYRRQASIGLILAVTVLFVALALTLVVKYRTTLMPCFFNAQSKYETLYSATEAAFDAEDAVQIIKASPADYKAAAAAAAKGDSNQTEPTAV